MQRLSEETSKDDATVRTVTISEITEVAEMPYPPEMVVTIRKYGEKEQTTSSEVRKFLQTGLQTEVQNLLTEEILFTLQTSQKWLLPQNQTVQLLHLFLQQKQKLT